MRLIVTFAIGDMPWVGPSVESMREYASKVGADFHEVKWFPDESGKPYNNNPVWAFVDFLKRFREQDYYKEVLVLDCDVLVLPSCPNLFDIEGDLICSLDQVWPVKDGRYKEWIAKYFPESVENTRGVEDPYFNAGILLFRLEALRALDLDPPYPDEGCWDQDFLNMRTAEAGIEITWVGEEYNQRNVDECQWPESTGEPLKKSTILETAANNHILHFVGWRNNKDRLIEYANILGGGHN
jgi:hypothetical protein